MKSSHFELVFEQHEIWRVKHASNVESMLCPYCAEETPMITAERLASALCESPRNIYRRIDDGSVHFVETTNMHVLVCLASFSKKA